MGSVNTEPTYYDNEPLTIRMVVQIGLRCDEDAKNFFVTERKERVFYFFVFYSAFLICATVVKVC